MALAPAIDVLVDQFLPVYDVSDTVAVVVDADAATTWNALMEVDLIDVGRRRPLVAALGAIRMLPDIVAHVLHGELPLRTPRQLRLRDTATIRLNNGGWVLLGERPRDEIALGLVGKFWRPVIDFAAVPVERFRDFAEPGYAKTVYSLSVRSLGDRRTLLSATTRTDTTDEHARRWFRRYGRSASVPAPMCSSRACSMQHAKWLKRIARLRRAPSCFEEECYAGTTTHRSQTTQLLTLPQPEPGRPTFKQISPSTQTAGFWSAVLATAFSIMYIVGQLAEWSGLLGSRGGPESASTPLGLVVLLTPSLLLGSSFLVLAVSVHQLAPADKRVWSHAAVAFATAYATLISIVYFVQLTFVTPRLVRGRTEDIEVFLFVPFDSFLYAVDILGYSFMSVATLFAAQVFRGPGLERIARMFLTANGLLVPFLAFQMYFHPLIWIASLWAVTFPGSTWTLALLFRRAAITTSAEAC